MKLKNALTIIISWLSVALYLAAGIAVIILKHNAAEYDKVILGTVLIMVGVTRIVIYFLTTSYKNPINISIITGGVMVALGFVFLFSGYDMTTLCFGWGIFETVISAIVIYQNAWEVKENRWVLIELAIALGILAFGIILCIRTIEALSGHLIFLGVSLILMSAYLAFNEIRTSRTRSQK